MRWPVSINTFDTAKILDLFYIWYDFMFCIGLLNHIRFFCKSRVGYWTKIYFTEYQSRYIWRISIQTFLSICIFIIWESQCTGADPEILKRGGALCRPIYGWLTKKILGCRWSKKAKKPLETISFGRNISTSIFKFSPFLYTMKPCQLNLIFVMNITQTKFLYWQNVHVWHWIKVNYKRSL